MSSSDRFYLAPEGATTTYVDPDGRNRLTGAFHAAFVWLGVDDGTEGSKQRYNDAYTGRYGCPPPPTTRWMIDDELIGTVSQLMLYAREHHVSPPVGSWGTAGLNDMDILDFCAVALPQGRQTDWYVSTFQAMIAEPGRMTPPSPDLHGKPAPGTFEAILATPGWTHMSYWELTGAAGREDELHDLAIAQLRKDLAAGKNVDAVTLTENYTVNVRPKRLLQMADAEAKLAAHAQLVS